MITLGSERFDPVTSRTESRRRLLVAMTVCAVVVGFGLSAIATSASAPPLQTVASRPSDIFPMVACPEPQGWWQTLDAATSGGVSGGSARAIVFDSQNNVYVGGDFTGASSTDFGVPIDSVTTSGVVRFDGVSGWSALGSGLNGNAFALAVDSQDNVYVGGTFTTAGGVTANKIAMWNGTSWSALGTGLNSTVGAIAVDSQDNVYVGGTFTTAGGVTANRVAKWSPSTSTWSALDSGLDGDTYSIALDSQNNVYVAGAFTHAGGDLANRIAKWNGSSWSPLGPGLNDVANSVTVDSAHGLVYVAGAFTATAAAPVITLDRVTVWDTRTNQFVPLLHGCSPNVPGLSDQSFSIVIKPQFPHVIFVGGSFTDAGGNGADRVAMWTWGFPEPSTGQLVDNYTATVGSQVTVTGLKLIGVTGVQIGTTPVTNFTAVDSTTIAITVPSGLATGVPLAINVTAVRGTGAIATLTVPLRVNLDPNGGTCRDGSITRSTSWTADFVGSRYLPSATDCTKAGHTFAGWARSSTPTIVESLPRSVDPADSVERYVLAADGNFIAVWTPTVVQLPETR